MKIKRILGRTLMAIGGLFVILWFVARIMGIDPGDLSITACIFTLFGGLIDVECKVADLQKGGAE